MSPPVEMREEGKHSECIVVRDSKQYGEGWVGAVGGIVYS